MVIIVSCDVVPSAIDTQIPVLLLVENYMNMLHIQTILIILDKMVDSPSHFRNQKQKVEAS